MTTKRIWLVTDARCLDHDTGGEGHPEVAERLLAIERRLEEGGLSGRFEKVPSRRAEWPWLLEAHLEEYLFRFEETALSGGLSLDDSDNRLCYDTYEAALIAAGAGPAGADLLETGHEAFPFCLVRPPGHHAESSRAMGFCFLNNAVIAGRYWQKVGGRKKLLVFDFDAHHGNGTQRAFESDPAVLYVSIHEHPDFSFPGTGYGNERGTGAGEGATLNIPLFPGAGDAEVVAALDDAVEPAVSLFRPEAIVVSAGFDGHLRDDMSGLSYSTGLFRLLGERIGRWGRDDRCGGRVLSILEGGYEPVSLGESTEAYLTGLTAS